MKILKVLIVLSSLFIYSLSFADDDEKKSHNHKKNHFYKNLDFLDLDKNQYNELRTILIDYKSDYKKYYKYKKNEEEELVLIMREEVFDTEKYINILKNIKNRGIQLEVDNLKKIHSILNKKQRKLFSHYLEDWEVD
ncbi:MAG: hypothetical protein C0625_00275 [Arcobacter sp.]|nr:MAG: hypothetical protein C0625_00275 [Arcobacter sp.]